MRLFFLTLRILIILFLASFLFTLSSVARLAFLEAEDKLPDEDKSEYEWAKSNYNTVLIHPAGTGKFEDDKGNSVQLDNFEVVWWHRANDHTIPSFFTENATMDAFLSFVEKGGSLFLSQVAFHYVFELGLESVEPRMCAPNVDHAETGIIASPGQENHPVYDGFKGVDPANGFNINCYGHDHMSDFYPSGPPKEGISLGMAYQEPHPQGWFGTVHPLCEYHVGDGIIIISGWRFTVFRSGEENCKYHDEMVKLHENIIAYLEESADVNIKGKLPTVWARIKR